MTKKKTNSKNSKDLYSSLECEFLSLIPREDWCKIPNFILINQIHIYEEYTKSLEEKIAFLSL